jgi:PilZ domain-containing protein
MSSERPIQESSLDQRSAPRVELFREIACASGRTIVRSQVADLSVGGMFVDTTRTPLPVGSRIVVRVSLRPEDPVLALDAEVCYVQEGIGMGVRFLHLAEEEREQISAFVDEVLHQKGPGGPPLRRSARVTVELPIRIRGADVRSDAFDESTRIITLSRHGACLVSAHSLVVGARLRLETASGHEFQGNVVWVGSGGQVGVQCRGLAQSFGFQFP